MADLSLWGVLALFVLSCATAHSPTTRCCKDRWVGVERLFEGSSEVSCSRLRERVFSLLDCILCFRCRRRGVLGLLDDFLDLWNRGVRLVDESGGNQVFTSHALSKHEVSEEFLYSRLPSQSIPALLLSRRFSRLEDLELVVDSRV